MDLGIFFVLGLILWWIPSMYFHSLLKCCPSHRSILSLLLSDQFQHMVLPAWFPHTHISASSAHYCSSNGSPRSPDSTSSLWTAGIYGLHPRQYIDTRPPFSLSPFLSAVGRSVHAVYSWRSVCFRTMFFQSRWSLDLLSAFFPGLSPFSAVSEHLIAVF